jgi:hypothetical protein
MSKRPAAPLPQGRAFWAEAARSSILVACGPLNPYLQHRWDRVTRSWFKNAAIQSVLAGSWCRCWRGEGRRKCELDFLLRWEMLASGAKARDAIGWDVQ